MILAAALKALREQLRDLNAAIETFERIAEKRIQDEYDTRTPNDRDSNDTDRKEDTDRNENDSKAKDSKEKDREE